MTAVEFVHARPSMRWDRAHAELGAASSKALLGSPRYYVKALHQFFLPGTHPKDVKEVQEAAVRPSLVQSTPGTQLQEDSQQISASITRPEGNPPADTAVSLSLLMPFCHQGEIWWG